VEGQERPSVLEGHPIEGFGIPDAAPRIGQP
jgi:hypothetical protein